MSKKRKLYEVTAVEVIRHLILGWLISAVIGYMFVPREAQSLAGLEGLAALSFVGTLIGTVILFIPLFLLARWSKYEHYERAGIAAAFMALAAMSLYTSFSTAFLIACLILSAILVVYAIRGARTSDAVIEVRAANKAFSVITALIATAFFVFVSAWTVCRVYSFSTPTFDFGIFAQMFHNMKETGIPMTTVERDGPLSHFNVHVSPVYYLLLPFYFIFPKPETLQVMQAAVLTSSVIPLWLIGKRRGLTGLQRTLLCTAFLFYPALSGGTSYDIHENCFLTPLILWVFYGIECKNTVVIAVFSLLTLTVKEDAAVYAAVIGLYLIVSGLVKGVRTEKRAIITGTAVLAVSLVWFFAVTGYLASSGDGVMTWRYKNFMYDGSSSLITVVKAVIISPFKALYECVDAEKLSFIMLTLLPLLGLPLLTRRFDRFVLLIPYVLINLMSDYQYQHDIFFQYTFGSIAFLFYLTALNISDFRINKLRCVALGTACVVGITLFSVHIVPKAEPYITRSVEKSEHYAKIREALSVIPEGASAAASTYYTTYLSNREVLYDIKHSSKEHVLECEYVAMTINSESTYKKYATDGKSGYDAFLELLAENGYEPIKRLEGELVIYRRTTE